MVQTVQRSPLVHKAAVQNPGVVYAKKLYKKGQYDSSLAAITGIIRTTREWQVMLMNSKLI
jgi:hypothetical protein